MSSQQDEMVVLVDPLPMQQEPSPPSDPPTLPDELVIEAGRQVSIRCGKASITLYANGKIALRGEYILSDAEGVVRIAGGRIELN